MTRHEALTAHRRELRVECVNAHDRCYGGTGGPCPYCEPTIPLRYYDGKFAPLITETQP